MSILKIAKMGHPVLRQVSEDIEKDDIDQLAPIVKDMIETMQDAAGTGLAAPQVYEPIRLVTYFVKAGRGHIPEKEDTPLTILINPVIIPIGDEKSYDWEGCLSVPGLTGLVPRFNNIKLDYFGLDGSLVTKELSGFHARVVQHECDHLDGILYPERMDDLSLLMYSEEMKHGVPEKAREILEEQRNS